MNPKRVLYVGPSETSPVETDFIREHGIARLSPEDLAGSPERVLEWLRASGTTKVAVHLDINVLDPALYDFLLSHDPYAAQGTYDEVLRVGCGLRSSPRSSRRSRRKPTSWPSPSTCSRVRSSCPTHCARSRSLAIDRAARNDSSWHILEEDHIPAQGTIPKGKEVSDASSA